MADSVGEAFLLSGCPRLRVVATTLKGYDNFDAEACSRHGVWLTVVPDTIIAPTAELAIGLVIGLMREIRQGDARVRGGGFAMEDWLLPGHPPAIPGRLLRHPRTLFTPHLGSAVDDVRRRMSLQAARQVRQVLEGKRPDHAVNHP